MKSKTFQKTLGAFAMVLALTVISSAQQIANTTTPSKIKIKNFGKMDERFYRGAQPKEADFKDLAALGIKTVIDLREDAPGYEKPAVESLGMKYINLPMVDKAYPKGETVAAFLKVVNDPATGKFFVHCAGGRHRTGALGAVYRFQFYNWTYDQAYQEMKQYDFYTSWGHEAFKTFVKAYYDQLLENKAFASRKSSGVQNSQTAQGEQER